MPSSLTTQLQSAPDPWEVDIKGGPDQSNFEISVLRRSNALGKLSYGWIGDSKVLIASSGGPCNYSVSLLVWNKLVEVAEATCNELNL